ncbi:MAG: FAD-dependent monooxygenase [Rhodospirillales bacterium]|nr:FAD-dependent monooxygenase [Rhodospirillales bacterium]
MTKTEIAISGGGHAGLITAILLAQKDMDVTLIEQGSLALSKELPEMSGRSVALMWESLEVVKQTGIWPEIEEFCAPLNTLRIMDGPESLSFDAEESSLPYFGQNVPNGILRAALIKKAHSFKNIHFIDRCGLWDFEEKDGYMLVRLEDDRELAAQLLIAADGKNSTARQIAGISTIKTGYGQTAITCLINHSRSHENISTEFHKPGGPFTLVPCPGNRSAVVWCEKDSVAEELMALKKSDFEQALQDKTQGIVGAITLETPPESWKLKGMLARKLVGHRLALIAEAAHAIHPIGAQGLNLSLRDIKALVALVARQKSLGLDLGSLTMLKEYKALRRGDTLTRFAGVAGFCAITSKKSKGIQRLRQTGMKFVNKSNFLRRQAMRIGLGMQGS